MYLTKLYGYFLFEFRKHCHSELKQKSLKVFNPVTVDLFVLSYQIMILIMHFFKKKADSSMGNRGGKDNKGVDRMKSIHVWNCQRTNSIKVILKDSEYVKSQILKLNFNENR